jgi:Flavoprotein
MSRTPRQPVIYLIACGGRPAGDLDAFITDLHAHGWDVCVVATPSALKFMDTVGLTELTGRPVRYDYKQPDEPDVFPPPDAFVVAPATFNTINKWANGSSDTLALGLLNEAIGLGIPVVAVPNPSTALAKHPAFVGERGAAAVLGRHGAVRSGGLSAADTQHGADRSRAVSLGGANGRGIPAECTDVT